MTETIEQARDRLRAILIRGDLSPAQAAKAERAIEIMTRLMATRDVDEIAGLADNLTRLRAAANDG